MKLIDFHPGAAEEAHDVAARYEAIRPSLGEDFQVELRAALTRIQNNPQMYAEYSEKKK